MNRYFLRLTFDGRRYSGWQIQENAISIQGELNRALSVILRQNINTVGCGRTDAGVHALQFYAHFDLPGPVLVDPEKTLNGVNALLESDIRVSELFSVGNHCHARFSATRRTYEYFIHHTPDSFLSLYSMFTHRLPDIHLMNSAAGSLTGEHDFSSFCKAHSGLTGFLCRVDQAKWSIRQDVMVFTISSNRFLRGMVRAITGTLLDVGFGKLQPEKLVEILEARDRTLAGVTVPAHALFLKEVNYPFVPVPGERYFPV